MNKLSFIVLCLVSVIAMNAWSFGAIESTENASFSIETWEDIDPVLASYDNAILVDTRTASEYEAGHIPGALLVPHTEAASNLEELDRETPIILYCQSGFRSGLVFDELVELGFTNVVNIGGISRWEGDLSYGSDP